MSDDPKSKGRSKARAGLPAGSSPEEPSASAASPAPGEPINADNLDEAFVKALEADFRQFGPTAIQAMRAEKPTEYVKLVAALRAKDAHAPANPLREMSDDELDSYIRERAARSGYEIRAVGAGTGSGRERVAPEEGADAE